MWNRRTVSAENTSKKPSEPSGSAGAAEAQQDRKQAKVPRSKLGASDPSMSKPESTSVAAEGNIPKVAEHSDRVQNSAEVDDSGKDNDSSQPTQTNTEPEPPMQSGNDDSKAEGETLKQSPPAPIAEVEENLPTKLEQEPVEHDNNITDATEAASDAKPKESRSASTANVPGIQVRKPSDATIEIQLPGAESPAAEPLTAEPLAAASAVSVPLPSVPQSSPAASSPKLALEQALLQEATRAVNSSAPGVENAAPQQPFLPDKATDINLNATEVLDTAQGQAALPETAQGIQSSAAEATDAARGKAASVPSVGAPSQLDTDIQVPSTKSITSKLTKRGSVLQKIRRLLVRKSILVLLLGKELGGITYSELGKPAVV